MDRGKPTTLRREGQSFDGWFRYADREAVWDPTASTLTTQRLSHVSVGEHEDVGFESEEWSINAYIIPLENDASVESFLEDPPEFAQSLDMRFGPHWDGMAFDFGEREAIAGVWIEPWVQIWQHPVTDALQVEPRIDFLRYHALRMRGEDVLREYLHPLDDVRVLSVAIEEVAFYDPTAHVTVHRSYLRDYLAARNAVMFVSIVADRIAIVGTRNELQLMEEGEVDLAPGVSCQIDVRTLRGGGVQARSSLYWTVIVRPARAPDYSRTPWPFYERLRKQLGDTGAPGFIVDADGNRQTLASYPGRVLYFKPTVLERYLNHEGYRVGFITRTWGVASGPRDTSIDVGINSKGLLTAFAPDLAKLTIAEQMYWAHHAVAPDGGPCYDWFMAREQGDPVDSPGVVELLEHVTSQLDTAWRGRFGGEIYRVKQPQEEKVQERDRLRMSVGPVTGQFSEITGLSKSLYEALVEPLKARSLRDILKSAGIAYTKDEKSLGLLRTLLAEALALPEDEVRAVMSPLRLLNELRVASAHTLSADIEAMLKKAGIRYDRPDPRSAWDALFDAVMASIAAAAAAIATSPL